MQKNLLAQLSATLSKADIIKLADEQHRNVQELISLTFYKAPQVAFHAAWLLEYRQKKFPDEFNRHLEYFMDSYPDQKNKSCQRHYTKILMGQLNSNRNIILKSTNLEAVTEATFEWLTDPGTPVAVTANCMDILFYLSAHFGWIADELKLQIEFLLRNGGAAIQSRGKRILAKLA